MISLEGRQGGDAALGCRVGMIFIEDQGVKVEQAAQNYDMRGLEDPLEFR